MIESLKQSTNPSIYSRLSLYFFIFALSGGAGLIYESIWTHYLKLFLGHAAYAQTLVLAIFMGGMAIGSALAARYGKNIKNALAAYAVVEAGIGVAAILFHPIYVGSVEYAYDTVFPNLQSSSILTLKWSLAAIMILPQSILLGATFPFMSAGILRRFPELPGRSLSFLYFNNSLGAAIGVLLSGYFLIPRLGLPGTIQFAGVINLLLAAAVWFLSRADGREQQQSALLSRTIGGKSHSTLLLMMLIAGITGAASFMYEIAWIRMLSMVLGATTHAFELMLSAFILGLAIGGFIVRRFIDRLQSPLKTLAYIQLAMGSLAAITLLIYGSAFDIMGYTVLNLDKTPDTYWLFNLICHGIALLVMLPATICAGMTLPLITYQLLSTGHGESAIGNVYAGNTLGAIIGIVLSIQWIMPGFGLKSLVLSGAGLDIGLGLGILIALIMAKRFNWRKLALPVIPAMLIFFSISLFIQLDPLAMASGIYTTGEIRREREMIFIKDGKTASISFFRNDDYLAVATNGKTEAAISDQELAKDEPTMILLGLLPLAIKPDAETVATIGIGSGLTSHSLLLSDQLKQVDTIEIEPAMVEAARLFGDRVDLTFSDPRSHIFIEDAKAYFTNNGSQYDLIISEPSNPWISGVAGLFSEEFYRHVRRYLHDDGLLVQWIHLYHIDLPQIASVVKALAPQFSDYRIYALNLSDIAIVATKKDTVPPLNAALFSQPAVASQLQRIGVNSLNDLAIRELGNKKQLEAFFNHFESPPNSDFAPYLDYSASRSRFLQASATSLLDLSNIPKAMLAFVNVQGRSLPRDLIGANYHLPFADSVRLAQQLANQVDPGLINNCETPDDALAWIQDVHQFADLSLPYFSQGEIDPVWQALVNSSCLKLLSETSLHWIKLYRALANGDAEQVIVYATALYPSRKHPENLGEQFLVAALLAAHNQLDDYQMTGTLLDNIDSEKSQIVTLQFIAATIGQNRPG
jgi:predicted membrane-bound spermidine synthase